MTGSGRAPFWASLCGIAALFLTALGQGTAAPLSEPVDLLATTEAPMTQPPQVPPPLRRDYPAKVKVQLEAVEKTDRLADDTPYSFWTYNGKVPGPFIRIRQGDTVLFHLSNHPDNHNYHNIVIQGLTGPGGGAAASLTPPGRTSIFSFQALNSGLFLYYCGTDPVEEHVANGMYGFLLVEPPGGLPPVDREYCLLRSEFYIVPEAGENGAGAFAPEKARQEQPDYVVLNGAPDALLGEQALTARTGERVRLFLGNIGPNQAASFSLIGEQFDLVASGGRTGSSPDSAVLVQLPAGGTAMAEFTPEVTGEYLFLDTALTRAFAKGARGVVRVTGASAPEVFPGRLAEVPYRPGALPEGYEPEDLAIRMRAGKRLYSVHCLPCHQEDGQGIAGPFPPLAGADYLLADKSRAIGAVVNGLKGPVTVNGIRYNGLMPAFDLADQEVADVLTYVLNSWGNEGGLVLAEEVQALRTAP